MANLKQKEADIALQEATWEKEKPLLEREIKLKEDKRNFLSKKKKKISTSKLLILFLFLNCTLIEIFVGYIEIKSLLLSTVTLLPADMTPLVTLVGAVVSEVIGYAVYAIKSAKENTAGGMVYELALMEQQQQHDDDAAG